MKAGKSQFNLEVIRRVKKFREANHQSQDGVAELLNMSRSYIGQVESPKHRAKYNLDHLNRLALEWKCSPRDFLPEEPLSETLPARKKKSKK